MSRKEYVYSAPAVQTQTDRAEIVSVTIDPPADRVALVIQKRFNGTVTSTETLVVKMANLDIFINNAAAFTGNGFLEKILRFFAQGGLLPPGGMVVAPADTAALAGEHYHERQMVLGGTSTALYGAVTIVKDAA